MIKNVMDIDKQQHIEKMFVDCINKGYEHFGFEGDFTFFFDDKAQISEDDIKRYKQLCEACNSDEFYDQLHMNAVIGGIDDIDIYEQCMRNHFNDGNALPLVKSIRIMGRKNKSVENILRKEICEFLSNRQKQSELQYVSNMDKNSSIICDKIPKERKVEDFIDTKSKEETFNEAISRLIDASGKKDSDIYRKAFVSKATFSNIRCGAKVSKMTALQLCIALELDYEQTQAILLKDGVALGNNKSDYIFEFFIRKGIYDLDIINEALYDNGCKTITKKD